MSNSSNMIEVNKLRCEPKTESMNNLLKHLFNYHKSYCRHNNKVLLHSLHVLLILGSNGENILVLLVGTNFEPQAIVGVYRFELLSFPKYINQQTKISVVRNLLILEITAIYSISWFSGIFLLYCCFYDHNDNILALLRLLTVTGKGGQCSMWQVYLHPKSEIKSNK